MATSFGIGLAITALRIAAQTVLPIWILVAGVWSDDGQWWDDANWNDGV